MSGKADASYQRVRGHLGALGMDAVAECLAGELEAAQKAKPSYADFLDKLLGVEVAAVEAKSHERRLRLAGSRPTSGWRSSTSPPSPTSTGG